MSKGGKNIVFKRRQALKTLGGSTLVSGLLDQLPKTWARPLIDSAVLPAHAQLTQGGIGIGGGGSVPITRVVIFRHITIGGRRRDLSARMRINEDAQGRRTLTIFRDGGNIERGAARGLIPAAHAQAFSTGLSVAEEFTLEFGPEHTQTTPAFGRVALGDEGRIVCRYPILAWLDNGAPRIAGGRNPAVAVGEICDGGGMFYPGPGFANGQADEEEIPTSIPPAASIEVEFKAETYTGTEDGSVGITLTATGTHLTGNQTVTVLMRGIDADTDSASMDDYDPVADGTIGVLGNQLRFGIEITVNNSGGSGSAEKIFSLTLPEDFQRDNDETLVLAIEPHLDYTVGANYRTTITIADSGVTAAPTTTTTAAPTTTPLAGATTAAPTAGTTLAGATTPAPPPLAPTTPSIPSVVQFAADAYSVVEGDSVTLRITKTDISNAGITFNLRQITTDTTLTHVNAADAVDIDVPARAGASVEITGDVYAVKNIFIPNGVSTLDIQITPLRDSEGSEGDESLVLAIEGPDAAQIGTPASATITITNRSQATGVTAWFDAPAYQIDEGGEVEIAMTRTGTGSRFNSQFLGYYIYVRIADRSTAGDADYDAIAVGTVRPVSGEEDLAKRRLIRWPIHDHGQTRGAFKIRGLEDLLNEGEETLVLEIEQDDRVGAAHDPAQNRYSTAVVSIRNVRAGLRYWYRMVLEGGRFTVLGAFAHPPELSGTIDASQTFEHRLTVYQWSEELFALDLDRGVVIEPGGREIPGTASDNWQYLIGYDQFTRPTSGDFHIRVRTAGGDSGLSYRATGWQLLREGAELAGAPPIFTDGPRINNSAFPLPTITAPTTPSGPEALVEFASDNYAIEEGFSISVQIRITSRIGSPTLSRPITVEIRSVDGAALNISGGPSQAAGGADISNAATTSGIFAWSIQTDQLGERTIELEAVADGLTEQYGEHLYLQIQPDTDSYEVGTNAETVIWIYDPPTATGEQKQYWWDFGPFTDGDIEYRAIGTFKTTALPRATITEADVTGHEFTVYQDGVAAYTVELSRSQITNHRENEGPTRVGLTHRFSHVIGAAGFRREGPTDTPIDFFVNNEDLNSGLRYGPDGAWVLGLAVSGESFEISGFNQGPTVGDAEIPAPLPLHHRYYRWTSSNGLYTVDGAFSFRTAATSGDIGPTDLESHQLTAYRHMAVWFSIDMQAGTLTDADGVTSVGTISQNAFTYAIGATGFSGPVDGELNPVFYVLINGRSTGFFYNADELLGFFGWRIEFDSVAVQRSTTSGFENGPLIQATPFDPIAVPIQMTGLPEALSTFTTTWQLAADDLTIRLPFTLIPEVERNYRVNWGDGLGYESFVGRSAAHTYASPGEYTVQVTGSVGRISFGISDETGIVAEDRVKIRSVDQWGAIRIGSLQDAFVNCINLKVTASDTPDLSQATSMRNMFLGCTSLVFENSNIGAWDVSTITDMNDVFNGATACNPDLSAWDVSRVTLMSGMLDNTALSIENYDKLLIAWSNLAVQPNVTLGANNAHYTQAAASARAILTNPPTSWTINDSGAAVRVEFARAAYIADEGGQVEITLNQNPAQPDNAVTVRIRRVDGTGANADLNDYQFNADADGRPDTPSPEKPEADLLVDIDQSRQDSRTFTLDLTADMLTEGTEQLVLEIVPGVGYSIGSQKRTTITVSDTSVEVPTTLAPTTPPPGRYYYQLVIENTDAVPFTVIGTFSARAAAFGESISSGSQLEHSFTVYRWSEEVFSVDVEGNTVMRPDGSKTTGFRDPFNFWNYQVGHVRFDPPSSGSFQIAVLETSITTDTGFLYEGSVDLWRIRDKGETLAEGLPGFNNGPEISIRPFPPPTITPPTTFSGKPLLAQFEHAAYDIQEGLERPIRVIVARQDGGADTAISPAITLRVNSTTGAALDRQGLGESQMVTATDLPAEVTTNAAGAFEWTFEVTQTGEYTIDIQAVADTVAEQTGEHLYLQIATSEDYAIGDNSQAAIWFFDVPEATQAVTQYWWDFGPFINPDTGREYRAIGTFKSTFTAGLLVTEATNETTEHEYSVYENGSLLYTHAVSIGVLRFPDGTTNDTYLAQESFAYRIGASSFELDPARGTVSLRLLAAGSGGGRGLQLLTRDGNWTLLGDNSVELISVPAAQGPTVGTTEITAPMPLYQQWYRWTSANDVFTVDGEFSFRTAETTGSIVVPYPAQPAADQHQALELSHRLTVYRHGAVWFSLDFDTSTVTDADGITTVSTGPSQVRFTYAIGESAFTDIGQTSGSHPYLGIDINNRGHALYYTADFIHGSNVGWRLDFGGENFTDATTAGFTNGPQIQDTPFPAIEVQIPATGLPEVLTTFQTTWQIAADDLGITLPFYFSSQAGRNYRVNWGDGLGFESFIGRAATHTYANAGEYTISVSGAVGWMDFADSPEDGSTQARRDRLRSVDQWGTVRFGNLTRAFTSCTNLKVIAPDAPDLSQVVNLDTCFFNCTSLVFENSNIGTWDVSGIGSMFNMFNGASAFNPDLRAWDVSSATKMTGMLDGTALSTANYDAMLIVWSTLTVQPNVTLGAADTQYTGRRDVIAARAVLTDTHNWTINDGGEITLPTTIPPTTPGPGIKTFEYTWTAPASITISITGRFTTNKSVSYGDTITQSDLASHEYTTYNSAGDALFTINMHTAELTRHDNPSLSEPSLNVGFYAFSYTVGSAVFVENPRQVFVVARSAGGTFYGFQYDSSTDRWVHVWFDDATSSTATETSITEKFDSGPTVTDVTGLDLAPLYPPTPTTTPIPTTAAVPTGPLRTFSYRWVQAGDWQVQGSFSTTALEGDTIDESDITQHTMTVLGPSVTYTVDASAGTSTKLSEDPVSRDQNNDFEYVVGEPTFVEDNQTANSAGNLVRLGGGDVLLGFNPGGVGIWFLRIGADSGGTTVQSNRYAGFHQGGITITEGVLAPLTTPPATTTPTPPTTIALTTVALTTVAPLQFTWVWTGGEYTVTGSFQLPGTFNSGDTVHEDDVIENSHSLVIERNGTEVGKIDPIVKSPLDPDTGSRLTTQQHEFQYVVGARSFSITNDERDSADVALVVFQENSDLQFSFVSEAANLWLLAPDGTGTAVTYSGGITETVITPDPRVALPELTTPAPTTTAVPPTTPGSSRKAFQWTLTYAREGGDITVTGRFITTQSVRYGETITEDDLSLHEYTIFRGATELSTIDLQNAQLTRHDNPSLSTDINTEFYAFSYTVGSDSFNETPEPGFDVNPSSGGPFFGVRFESTAAEWQTMWFNSTQSNSALTTERVRGFANGPVITDVTSITVFPTTPAPTTLPLRRFWWSWDGIDQVDGTTSWRVIGSFTTRAADGETINETQVIDHAFTAYREGTEIFSLDLTGGTLTEGGSTISTSGFQNQDHFFQYIVGEDHFEAENTDVGDAVNTRQLSLGVQKMGNIQPYIGFSFYTDNPAEDRLHPDSWRLFYSTGDRSNLRIEVARTEGIAAPAIPVIGMTEPSPPSPPSPLPQPATTMLRPLQQFWWTWAQAGKNDPSITYSVIGTFTTRATLRVRETEVETHTLTVYKDAVRLYDIDLVTGVRTRASDGMEFSLARPDNLRHDFEYHIGDDYFRWNVSSRAVSTETGFTITDTFGALGGGGGLRRHHDRLWTLNDLDGTVLATALDSDNTARVSDVEILGPLVQYWWEWQQTNADNNIEYTVIGTFTTRRSQAGDVIQEDDVESHTLRVYQSGTELYQFNMLTGVVTEQGQPDFTFPEGNIRHQFQYQVGAQTFEDNPDFPSNQASTSFGGTDPFGVVRLGLTLDKSGRGGNFRDWSLYDTVEGATSPLDYELTTQQLETQRLVFLEEPTEGVFVNYPRVSTSEITPPEPQAATTQPPFSGSIFHWTWSDNDASGNTWTVRGEFGTLSTSTTITEADVAYHVVTVLQGDIVEYTLDMKHDKDGNPVDNAGTLTVTGEDPVDISGQDVQSFGTFEQYYHNFAFTTSNTAFTLAGGGFPFDARLFNTVAKQYGLGYRAASDAGMRWQLHNGKQFQAIIETGVEPVVASGPLPPLPPPDAPLLPNDAFIYVWSGDDADNNTWSVHGAFRFSGTPSTIDEDDITYHVIHVGKEGVYQFTVDMKRKSDDTEGGSLTRPNQDPLDFDVGDNVMHNVAYTTSNTAFTLAGGGFPFNATLRVTGDDDTVYPQDWGFDFRANGSQWRLSIGRRFSPVVANQTAPVITKPADPRTFTYSWSGLTRTGQSTTHSITGSFSTRATGKIDEASDVISHTFTLTRDSGTTGQVWQIDMVNATISFGPASNRNGETPTVTEVNHSFTYILGANSFNGRLNIRVKHDDQFSGFEFSGGEWVVISSGRLVYAGGNGPTITETTGG